MMIENRNFHRPRIVPTPLSAWGLLLAHADPRKKVPRWGKGHKRLRNSTENNRRSQPSRRQKLSPAPNMAGQPVLRPRCSRDSRADNSRRNVMFLYRALTFGNDRTGWRRRDTPAARHARRRQENPFDAVGGGTLRAARATVSTVRSAPSSARLVKRRKLCAKSPASDRFGSSHVGHRQRNQFSGMPMSLSNS